MSKTIRVGRGRFMGNTNAVLQRAMDVVAKAGGGVVEIPEGIYRMNDSLHLRSRVRVIGVGKAVLRKVPSVTSPVADYLGYGHYEFTVAEPEKFCIGMGVHLTDRRAGGFYDTVATITGRQGRLFFIDRMLNHDYGPSLEGRVSTLFPIISGWEVSDVTVKDLVLDGNPKETRRLNGCRGGGVFLLRCHRATIEGLEVRHYFGDAISFQQCTDISVLRCHLHDNLGSGLHPGSGSARYEFRGNQVARNTSYGLFYCLRTTHSLAEENQIEENGLDGVSIGERDTNHLICGNLIRGNGGAGIDFRKPLHCGGDDVIVAGNRIEGNCRKKGTHEIVLPSDLHRIWITGNSIRPSKGKALFVGAGCADIRVVGNTISGRPQSRHDVAGKATGIQFTPGSRKPSVGTHAVPADAARHLNVDCLPRKKNASQPV